MWMSKIKKYLKELDLTPVLNAMFIFSMICIALVYTFAVINGIKEVVGYKNIDKAVSVISSLATALTLAFLVYQHKVSNSKIYQVTMVEEAKLVVDKMVEQIDILNTWNNGDISKLATFLSRMSNHALNLETLFNKIDDVALKYIILIRWQDMYFNHYESAVGRIDAIEMIKNNLDMSDPICARDINRIEMNTSIKLRSDAKNYNYYKTFIDSVKEEGYFSFSKEIGFQIGFDIYFFDNKNIEKYLDGFMNVIDPKHKYPSLYAIVEASTR
ncbi:hypothetical protein RA180_12935 [Aeromonas salmonicida]|uniref:hypothetical protein n=1 Tax=Aeromonas salmonicida TaxID=645 RepID=UPI002796C66E|nr:hypothetical protein [Aeromonas salmonicida]MDQ1884897.1 hypothetical protein [Aeromonas salmonicida]